MGQCVHKCTEILHLVKYINAVANAVSILICIETDICLFNHMSIVFVFAMPNSKIIVKLKLLLISVNRLSEFGSLLCALTP